MNTHAEKIQLTKWILDTDFWTSLTHEQKEDIELGISEISKGEKIEYDTFMNKYR